MGTWAGWQQAVLAALGVPVTVSNERFLSDWQPYEGGSASFNPLNTTEPWAGATSYNMVGVKNYPSASAGAQATAATLKNGNYPSIMAALRTGDPYTFANASGVADNISTWGTPNYAAAFLLAAGAPAGAPGANPPPTPAPAPVPTTGKATLEQAWRNLTHSLAVRNPRRVKANRIIVGVLRTQRRAGR